MPNNRINDESSDRAYFTITPRIVWALAEDTQEYTLWCVIKDIAGEAGECFLSTSDLALLAMQSAGSVSMRRKRLLNKGLLHGELRRDPGYPQQVWHLSIPDLWTANLDLAQELRSLRARIAYKADQKEPSPGEGLREPSRGEGGIAPGEGGIAPGETKKNHKEDPKGEHAPRRVAHGRAERAALAQDQELVERTGMRASRDRFAGEIAEITLEPDETLVQCPVCQDFAREWPRTQKARSSGDTLRCGCGAFWIVHAWRGERRFTYKHPNLPDDSWTVHFDDVKSTRVNDLPCSDADLAALLERWDDDRALYLSKLDWLGEQDWARAKRYAIISRANAAFDTTQTRRAARAASDHVSEEDLVKAREQSEASTRDEIAADVAAFYGSKS